MKDKLQFTWFGDSILTDSGHFAHGVDVNGLAYFKIDGKTVSKDEYYFRLSFTSHSR